MARFTFVSFTFIYMIFVPSCKHEAMEMPTVFDDTIVLPRKIPGRWVVGQYHFMGIRYITGIDPPPDTTTVELDGSITVDSSSIGDNLYILKVAQRYQLVLDTVIFSFGLKGLESVWGGNGNFFGFNSQNVSDSLRLKCVYGGLGYQDNYELTGYRTK